MADIRTSDLGFEAELFKAADRLRGNSRIFTGSCRRADESRAQHH